MNPTSQLRVALEGRYTVEREIGAGGMATVYLATDVRHQRKVALKVLDPDLGAVLGVERFLSEIQVTANLQHPNLLPLFDSGEAGGLLFYVMPFVDGESLRARLTRERQLPVDEAIHIAVAVASGLEYAHRHGVIHRDLKPENILLQAGQPVIADFGIALAVSKAGGARITHTGISLGTPQYMSPEQASGDRVIDNRTDVYSLGVVLYEMLTGDPPHAGSTVQAIMARLLTERARSVQATRASVPMHVDAAITRALEKVPADRFSSAQEFVDALHGKIMPTPVATPRSVPRSFDWRVAAGGVLVGALLMLGAWMIQRSAGSESEVTRLSLTAPSDAPFATGLFLGAPFAISPNAQAVVYSALGPGGPQLAVRRLSDAHVKMLPNTLGYYPVFSADGRSIFFFNGVVARRVDVDGGPAADITPSTIGAGPGASATPNGILVVGGTGINGKGLGTIDLTKKGEAARVRELTVPDSADGQLFHKYPVVLADGETVLFASYGRQYAPGAHIGIVSLKDRVVRVLDIQGIYPLGMIDNTLIYARTDGTSATIMGVPFDLRARRVTGKPVELEADVASHGNGSLEASLARDGTLVYKTGRPMGRLMLLDRTGAGQPVVPDAHQFLEPRFSPDGKRIVVHRADETSEIWIYDLATRVQKRLTSQGAQNDRPEWTPDGKRVLYRSDRAGRSIYWSQPADGTGTADSLLVWSKQVGEAIVMPDGKSVVFRTSTESNFDLYRQSLTGDRTPTPVARSSFSEYMAAASPDGRWLAFVANDAGVLDVYVQSMDGPKTRLPVSIGGGTEPRWSPDSREIVYRAKRKMIAAHLTTSPSFEVTSRDTLFDDRFDQNAFHANWDLAPDGRHLLMIDPVENHQEIVVVLNWARFVRERMKAGR